MPDDLYQDMIRQGSTSERPANAPYGMLYFDTTLATIIMWDGNTWINPVFKPPAAGEERWVQFSRGPISRVPVSRAPEPVKESPAVDPRTPRTAYLDFEPDKDSISTAKPKAPKLEID
jgi:hypothetical protein